MNLQHPMVHSTIHYVLTSSLSILQPHWLCAISGRACWGHSWPQLDRGAPKSGADAYAVPWPMAARISSWSNAVWNVTLVKSLVFFASFCLVGRNLICCLPLLLPGELSPLLVNGMSNYCNIHELLILVNEFHNIETIQANNQVGHKATIGSLFQRFLAVNLPQT